MRLHALMSEKSHKILFERSVESSMGIAWLMISSSLHETVYFKHWPKLGHPNSRQPIRYQNQMIRGKQIYNHFREANIRIYVVGKARNRVR